MVCFSMDGWCFLKTAVGWSPGYRFRWLYIALPRWSWDSPCGMSRNALWTHWDSPVWLKDNELPWKIYQHHIGKDLRMQLHKRRRKLWDSIFCQMGWALTEPLLTKHFWKTRKEEGWQKHFTGILLVWVSVAGPLWLCLSWSHSEGFAGSNLLCTSRHCFVLRSLWVFKEIQCIVL